MIALTLLKMLRSAICFDRRTDIGQDGSPVGFYLFCLFLCARASYSMFMMIASTNGMFVDITNWVDASRNWKNCKLQNIELPSKFEKHRIHKLAGHPNITYSTRGKTAAELATDTDRPSIRRSATASTAPTPSIFIAISPCRILFVHLKICRPPWTTSSKILNHFKYKEFQLATRH